MNKITITIFVVLALSTASRAADALVPYAATPATAPAQAAGTFRVLDNFEMQLLAAEPLVTDPVAIAYDEFGRAYVAEMNDYPYTDKSSHRPAQENPTDEPIGKIRLLEDRDNDGIFDRSTVFADTLSWPTGVVCSEGGIFVTATPDLWYFKDIDGDGVADIRRKVFTGFRKYNVQAVMNTPLWGLDHHIYISGSTNGGTITKTGAPDAEPLAMSRHDLRFSPSSGTLELESGYGRFGNTFDDYGNRFICNIRNPALHVVLPKRFLDRNPHLPPQRGIEDIGDFGDFLPVFRVSPPEAWRVERALRWTAEEPDRHPATELVGGGAVTSSAGITVYRGDAYPEKYRGQIFVADVSSNLFYRLALEASGATFKATRIDAQADFVASEDVWFRPVNLVNAPDGCLHVLDMYREAIEHPWSIPDDIHARIDLERGRDRGRIFRLAPPGFERRATPRIGDLPAAKLVALLEHPNAWHRETAHRLLHERKDDFAIAPLRRLLAGSEIALARIHALWSLAGLDALEENDITRGLGDPSPRVREQAIRAAEKFSPRTSLVPGAVTAALTDPDARVRFHALLSPHLTADASALAALARAESTDPWFEGALLCSSLDRSTPLLLALLELADPAASPSLLRDLAQVVALKKIPGETTEIIRALSDADAHPLQTRLPAAAGLADGLKRNGLNLFRVASESVDDLAFRNRTLADARALVADASEPLELRAIALTLFRSTGFAEASAVYGALLDAQVPVELQSTALASLSAFHGDTVAPILLEAWPRLSPRMRQQAVEAMLTRPERLVPLLDAIAKNTVSPHLITSARRNSLIAHSDSAIANRAKSVFQGGDHSREEVVARYREALATAKSDPASGETVFNGICIACHRAGDLGFSDLGPNLSTVRKWDHEQLLVNILDPNREISPSFIEYLVTKSDGTVLSGAVLNETEAAILLRLPDGTRKAVYRRDIETIENTGLSLMPDGLEAVISPRQMADLIAFLTNA